MTKVELIAAVANDANLTKKDAEAAVNSALNAITAALKDGDKVTLVGFGTFEVRERPERKGRNPHRPESPDQGDHRDPRFRCSHLQGRQGSEGRRSVT